MKYFFLLVLIFTNFVLYGMGSDENNQSEFSIVPREKINESNTKRHKKKIMCHKCRKLVACITRHNRAYHTGEKPYKCLICPKTFVESGPCVNHIREDHPEVKEISYRVHFLDKNPYTRFLKTKIQTKTLVEESFDDELLKILNQEDLIAKFLAEQKDLALINNPNEITPEKLDLTL